MSDQQEPQAQEHREPAEKPSAEEGKPLGIILFALFIAVCVATSIASTQLYWMRQYQPGSTVEVSLWWVTTTTSSGTSVTPISDQCDELAARLETGAAFGIISCVVSFAALVFAVIAHRTGKLRLLALIFGVCVLLDSIICWAVVARAYLEPYCTANSLKDTGFDLGPGAWLMIFTSISSALGVLALHFNPKHAVTKEARRVHTSLLFAFFGLVSTLFCGIGCGLPLWKYRTTANVVTEVSIWKTNTAGAITNNFDIDCYDLSKLFRAAASFSIASTLLSVACMIIGIIRYFKPVSVIPAFVFGGLTTITTLITWALLTNIWGRRFCDSMQTYEQSFYIRLPAYGFFVASFAAMFVGTLLIVKASIMNRKPETTFPPLNVILVATTLGSLLFALVGMTLDFFNLTGQGNAYTRVYLWYVDQQAADNTFTHWANFDVYFACDQMNSMFRAVRYLQLAGVIFGGIATLFVFMIFKVPRLRILVLIANYFSAGLYGVALALWIIAYYNTFCGGGNIYDRGFSVSSGGALQIIGFLLTLFGAVLPCIDGAPKSE